MKLLLSEIGSSRATAYTSNATILTHGSTVHFAWTDYVEAASNEATRYHTKCRSYDVNNGTLGTTLPLGVGEDNHTVASLTVDDTARLYAIVGRHHQPMKFRLRNALDPVWSKGPSLGAHSTYPSLVTDSRRTLHAVFRENVDAAGAAGRTMNLCYQRKSWGSPWSAMKTIAHFPGEAYRNYEHAIAVDASDTLHLAFVFFSLNLATSNYVAYLRSADGGETWHAANLGTPIALPAGRNSPCLLPAHRSDAPDRAVTSGMACTTTGTPFVCVDRPADNPNYASLFVLTPYDNTWREHPINTAPDTQVLRGGASMTVTGSNRVIVVASGTKGGRNAVLAFCSSDAGATFRETVVEFTGDNKPFHVTIERPVSRAFVNDPWIVFSLAKDRTVEKRRVMAIRLLEHEIA